MFKFFVLFIVSLICFGPYFAYDSIQNIAGSMKQQIGITDTKFGALYAVYSFPNMILPFFGGVAGDKLGLRLAALVFVTLVVLGSVRPTLLLCALRARVCVCVYVCMRRVALARTHTSRRTPYNRALAQPAHAHPPRDARLLRAQTRLATMTKNSRAACCGVRRTGEGPRGGVLV